MPKALSIDLQTRLAAPIETNVFVWRVVQLNFAPHTGHFPYLPYAAIFQVLPSKACCCV